jgi:hypothetical protein
MSGDVGYRVGGRLARGTVIFDHEEPVVTETVIPEANPSQAGRIFVKVVVAGRRGKTMTAIVGFGNPECYARELGGCVRQINREHYISESILRLIEHGSHQPSNSVRTSGLAFQEPADVRQIGIASLTAKVLCEKHNGLLSPYDNAGKAMFQAVDALYVATGKPDAPHREDAVDGDAFERWMLKSLLGGLYSGNFRATETGVLPSVGFLEILFAGGEFPDKQGLYWMPIGPGAVTVPDTKILRVAPLVAGGDVLGLTVWLFGFEFVLLTAQLISETPTRFAGASYRPAGMWADGSNARIKFDWKDGAQSGEIALRHVRP